MSEGLKQGVKRRNRDCEWRSLAFLEDIWVLFAPVAEGAFELPDLPLQLGGLLPRAEVRGGTSAVFCLI